MTNGNDRNEGESSNVTETNIKTSSRSTNLTLPDTASGNIHIAASFGNLEAVKYFAEKTSNVNAKDKDNNTALYLAAQNGHFDTLKYLLDEKNADINARNNGGKTVMHVAASTGNLNLVKSLLERKADFNAKDDDGFAPLLFAAKHGHLQIIKYFIEEIGVTLSVVCNLMSRPLAAYYGHLEVVKYLASKETESIADINNRATLFAAVQNNHLEIVKNFAKEHLNLTFHPNTELYSILFAAEMNNMFNLITAEAKDLHDVSISYVFSIQTKEIFTILLLIFCVKNGHEHILKYLIDQKHADINAKLDNHINLLNYAAANGHIDIVKYLITEKQVDFKAENKYGMTPLLFAVKNNHLNIVKFIAEKGATLDSSTHKALVLAAASGNLDITKYLLKNGADVNEASKGGMVHDLRNILSLEYEGPESTYIAGDPLYNAIKYGHLNIVQYLLEKGADIDVSTLHTAAENGHLDIVKYLVDDRQVNVNIEDNLQRTALYYAINNCHLPIVKYLADRTKNAFANTDTTMYSTLLDNAIVRGHFDLVRYLIENGILPSNVDNVAKSGNLNMVKYILEKTKDHTVFHNGNQAAILYIAAEKGHLDIVKYLVDEKHASFTLQDSHGKTPLEHAVMGGHLDICKYFIEDKHVDPYMKDPNYVAFAYPRIFNYIVEKSNYSVCNFDICISGAVNTGNLNLLKYLVSNETNVDLNRISYGNKRPILFLAMSNGDFDIVKYLVEKGANINAKTKGLLGFPNNLTLLHMAATNSDTSTVEYLLKNGANINAKTDSAVTPLGMANLSCNTANADFLKSKGASRRRRNTEFDDLAKIRYRSRDGDQGFPENYHHVSSSSTKPSSWINVFGHTIVQSIIEISQYMYSSFTPPALDEIKYDQSSSCNVTALKNSEINKTLLLLDVFVRKMSGRKYISTSFSDVSIMEITGYALQITDEFEKLVKEAAKNSKLSLQTLKIDFTEAHKEITRKITSFNFNEISHLFISYIEKVCCDQKFESFHKEFRSLMVEFDKVNAGLHRSRQNIVCREIDAPPINKIAADLPVSFNNDDCYLNKTSAQGRLT